MNIESLKEWLDANYITYSIRRDILVIPGWGRALIQDMDKCEHIFKTDKEGNVVFNSDENVEYLITDEIFYVVFLFGARWYYIDIRDEKQEFHVLKYVGQSPKFEVNCPFYPLGIHSSYELLNGSGSMAQWIKKIKFYGYKGLGIADKNTMACTLDLQKNATGGKISYCFGYSLTVIVADTKVPGIVYVGTQEGFRNLLRIQKYINVDSEERSIDMLKLFQWSSGNVFVFGKLAGCWLAENEDVVPQFMEAFDDWVYYQVDTTEYRADRVDSEVLVNLKAFFDHYYIEGIEYRQDLRPALIQDVYYLDKDDWKNKITLNKIATGAPHEQSHMQYLKTMDELYDEYNALFSDKYNDEVFLDMCQATVDIMEGASAAYDLTENYAPKYNLTPEEQDKYGSALNMFLTIIEEGFERLVPKDKVKEYRERIEYEKYVIMSTDNLDYFLITYEEVNWARQNGILTGLARGSAGGCLLSYLMGITQIDPIQYGLIFERFLLPERGGLAPADVTKVLDNMDSRDYFELELDNGKKYKFDKDAQFFVKRDGQEITVYADELQEGDDIIWDRKDELFTL